MKESKSILEDISGQGGYLFGAPALRVNKNTIHALEESEYEIDSSVASQRFDMFMSLGVEKIKLDYSTRLPYRVSKHSLFKRGNSSIIEVPLSASLFPYVGTKKRIFSYLTSIQRRLLLELNLVASQ